MTTFLSAGIFAAASVMATQVAAACWDARQLGVQGPAVEICYGGQCEQAHMVLECANALGATIAYSNGWQIDVQISGSAAVETVSYRQRVLAPNLLSSLTCRDLEVGAGACRFPQTGQAAQPDASDSPLSLIEMHFRAALGVDAETVQLSLLEAGLYSGAVDGEWGPQTQDAFIDALDWAHSRGMQYDVRTENGFYDFVWSIRSALFDVDSGLSRSPSGDEFLLVTGSRRTVVEADQMVTEVDGRLTARGYPNRTYWLTAANGWYAVVAGMYSKDGCRARAQTFISMGLIPSDSYCAGLDRFDPMNWTR